MPCLEELIPDFVAASTEGEVDLHATIDGSWSLVMVLPKSFDAVATTELAALSESKEDLEERGVKVIVISCDSLTNHMEWKRDAEELHQCDIRYPIVADADRSICHAYGLCDDDKAIPPASLAVIAAPNRLVKWAVQYPRSSGHNINEILRMFDALQMVDNNPDMATGVNWMAGEDVFVLRPDTKPAKGVADIYPWFRLTPAPDLPT